MKKNVKSTFIICIIFSLLTFVGCTSNAPTTVVDAYMKETTNGSNNQLNAYLDEEIEKLLINSNLSSNQVTSNTDIDLAIDSMFNKIEYEIQEETIDGKRAIVTLNIKNIKLGTVMSNFFTQGIIPLLSQVNITQTTTNLTTLLSDLILNAKSEERLVKVNLTNSNGEWKVEESDSLYKSILGILE